MRGQTWLLGFYSSDRNYGNVINKDQKYERRKHKDERREKTLKI